MALAVLLYALDPDMLAHGQVVTNDLGLTLFLFATVVAFERVCERVTLLRVALAGLALGAALATKFSGVALFPILGVLALVTAFAPEPVTVAGSGLAPGAFRICSMGRGGCRPGGHVVREDLLEGPVVDGAADSEHGVAVGFEPPRPGALEPDVADQFVGRLHPAAATRQAAPSQLVVSVAFSMILDVADESVDCFARCGVRGRHVA